MALYTKRVAPGTYIEHFSIPNAPISGQDMDLIIGVQGVSRRGALDKPVKVNQNNYKQILGGYITGSVPMTVGTETVTSDLIYELDQYFANSPLGADILVKRIYPKDKAGLGVGIPKESFANFDDGDAPTNILKISAKNAGSWGNSLDITITNVERVNSTAAQKSAAGGLLGDYFIQLDNNSSAMLFKEGDRIKVDDGTDVWYYDVREVDLVYNKLVLFTPLVANCGVADITTTEFNIYIIDTDINGLKEEEYFNDCNLNKYSSKYVETLVNDTNYPSITGSNLIKVEVLPTIDETTLNPEDIQKKLTGGDDGTVDIVLTDWTDYTLHWDGYRINVLANVAMTPTDFSTEVDVIKGALNYATDERYWLGGIVFCQPSTLATKDNTLDTAYDTRTWRLQDLGVDNKKAKMYDTYYDIPETFLPVGADPRKKMSPVGAVLGVYKRFAKGIGLHTACAGYSQNFGDVDSTIVNALELYLPIDQERYQTVVYPFGINSFRNIGNKIVVFGDRSLTREEMWQQQNYTIYMAVLESAIKSYYDWVPFKPDTVDTYKKIEELADSFFADRKKHYKIGPKNPKGYFFRVLNLLPEYKDKIEKGYIIAEFGVSLFNSVQFFIVRSALAPAE